jgi:uncharacterized Zn finger protein
MEPLDGNAIGGLLIDVFGADMTGAIGTCGFCGDTGPVAELVVYRQAPGTVARCRACGNILMVFVKVRSMTCVDLTGMARMDRPGAA